MHSVTHHTAALLLRFAGLAVAATAILCSPWLFSPLDPTPPLSASAVSGIAASRATLLSLGLALFILGELVAPGAISRRLGPEKGSGVFVRVQGESNRRFGVTPTLQAIWGHTYTSHLEPSRSFSSGGGE